MNELPWFVDLQSLNLTQDITHSVYTKQPLMYSKQNETMQHWNKPEQ